MNQKDQGNYIHLLPPSDIEYMAECITKRLADVKQRPLTHDEFEAFCVLMTAIGE